MSDLIDIINNTHRDVPFGTVYIAIKKYDGKVATVDSNQIVNHKTPQGNVQALSVIGTIMKGLTTSLKELPPEIPPTTTITLFYGKNGEVSRLQVNGFKRTPID